jgi:hypothetical protein
LLQNTVTASRTVLTIPANGSSTDSLKTALSCSSENIALLLSIAPGMPPVYITSTSPVRSRKGFWTFSFPAVVFGHGLSFVNVGGLPSEMRSDKKQEYRDNDEECPVKRALVERSSPGREEQEREGKAGNGQVFIRDAPDCLHTCINEGERDNYFVGTRYGNGLVFL